MKIAYKKRLVTKDKKIALVAHDNKKRDLIEWAKFNKVLLDPSRAGAAEILHNFRHWQPERIVYVSCNPATLARDAGVLVGIGGWMGWHADQAGKLILAGPSAALAGIAMGFVVHQVGGSWFEGGFVFGGAHAFFRVLGGFFWALVGYGAHALKGRDLIESEQDIHERNT